MDNDEKRDVHTHVHPQDGQEDTQPTNPEMNTYRVRPVFSHECGVSVDILSYFSDDYQISQNIKYEDEQEEDVKCYREGDNGGLSEMMCLQSVKMEEEVQQSNDQYIITPFKYSAHISTSINGVNTFVDVKKESKLDIGVRNSSSEHTRHWIVCSGNVLKEVKAEQTVSKSVTECGEDLYEKQQQCRIHNTNADETETDLIPVKSSASGLSLTQSCQHEPDEDANKFACDTCGTPFMRRGSHEVDISCHRRVNMYTCHLCTALRASQRERNVPEKILTSVKHFACSTCGKSFARVAHLREHELIHLGVKPFTCTLCGKSFMRVGHLRDHETIHSGMKSFTCTRCGKSFAWARNLREHERIHSGVKPFPCTICGKSFSRAGKLREHERYHSGVTPFTCTLCGKSFTTMGNQRRHERILCSDKYSCTT